MVNYAGGFSTSTHVIVMVAPDVMRQFMAQHSTNLPVTPKSVVAIGTDTKFDGLSPVGVQPQELWVFMRSKFRQQSDRELVRIHHMEDCLIVR